MVPGGCGGWAGDEGGCFQLRVGAPCGHSAARGCGYVWGSPQTAAPGCGGGNVLCLWDRTECRERSDGSSKQTHCRDASGGRQLVVGVPHLTTPNHPAGAHGAMRCRGRAARTSLPFPNPAGGRARPRGLGSHLHSPDGDGGTRALREGWHGLGGAAGGSDVVHRHVHLWGQTGVRVGAASGSRSLHPHTPRPPNLPLPSPGGAVSAATSDAAPWAPGEGAGPRGAQLLPSPALSSPHTRSRGRDPEHAANPGASQ